MISPIQAFKKNLHELDQKEGGDDEFDFFKSEAKIETTNNPLLEMNEEENSGQATENEKKDSPEEEKWLQQSYDGKLAVDVYQTPNEVVIKSTIAGCEAEDIDISINNEIITIRGVRTQEEEVPHENFFYQECYWGGFSRSIILPVEIDASKTEATIRSGVLTIRLPKAKDTKNTTIRVESLDEDEAEDISDEVM